MARRLAAFLGLLAALWGGDTCCAAPIGVAKAAGPGWTGQVTGIVTAIYTDYDRYVLEQEDRSAAIIVRPLPQRDLRQGDEVLVYGTVQDDGSLLSVVTAKTGRVYVPVTPLGVTNRAIIGGPGAVGVSNLDLLVRIWGRMLDTPSRYPDGSTRFHITDGAAAGGPPELFSDTFDTGRRPEWFDAVGSTFAQAGKLVADDAVNIVLVNGLTFSDGSVTVEATAGVQMGIVVRYQDPDNFVLAFFSPTQGSGPILGFHERVNGQWGPWINPVAAGGMSGTVTMALDVAGSAARVVLSDGVTSRATSCTLNQLLAPGRVGLYHDTSAAPDAVRFDDFVVRAAADADAVEVIAPPAMGQLALGGPGDFVQLTGIAGKSGPGLTGGPRLTLVPGQMIPRGYFAPVVVALDGTGDFGPNTPGTKTAGWQEAIDYCAANGRDLYIKGGWLGPVYNISDTIRFPPLENFKLLGGMYVLNWTGPSDRDMISIDSARNCDFFFGLVVYGGQLSCCRVRTQNNLPGGGPRIFSNNRMRFEAATDPYPFQPGPRTGLGAVTYDTSMGSIVGNDIYFVAAINFATDIQVIGTGSFSGNRLRVAHLHTNAVQGTLLKCGTQTRQNIFYLAMGVDQGATQVTGLDMEGSNNIIDLVIRNGFESNYAKAVILRAGASGNHLTLSVPGSNSPLMFFTDEASNPTNRVSHAGRTIPVQTVSVTAGTFTYTQRLVPAVAVISSGTVTGVAVQRGADIVDCTETYREGVYLSVGDSLVITSTSAPTLRLIPHQ